MRLPLYSNSQSLTVYQPSSLRGVYHPRKLFLAQKQLVVAQLGDATTLV